MAHTDKLQTTSIFIAGDPQDGYEVDLNEKGEVVIWCENSQAVWTTLYDLRSLVNRLDKLVVWKEPI